MSTVQSVQKTPRRAGKKSSSHHARNALSENEASSGVVPGEGTGRPRGKSHANKKHNASSDAAVHSDSQAQRSISHAPKTHATPVKSQAYAGPTFHQSPAASALPMPSFYSKSLPNSGLMRPVSEGAEQPAVPALPPVLQSPEREPKRETTPLDFLFEAARRAQGTPGSESPHHMFASANGTPSSRSPAPRDNDVEFPFEMDPTEKPQGGGDLTFSTPYKDRIEALKSTRSASEGGKSLDDGERSAKTAALKKFLLNSAHPPGGQNDNPFNARPVPPQSGRNRSNPTTPMSKASGNDGGNNYFPQMPYASYVHTSPSQRPPSSNLRNIYAPDNFYAPAELPSNYNPEQPRISTARESTPTRSIRANDRSTPSQQSHGQSSMPSAQQLEDDLRRVLKLDLGARG